METFFAAHYRDAKRRLHEKTLPYDQRRAALRKERLQSIHDKQLDAEAGYRFGTHGRKPPLWQVEGDRS
jgi:hypothetical protein